MRKNLPVTEHEVVMQDDQIIISETNLKGIITEVNGSFIEISGYSRDELIGKNHNIIRHPDMPAAAFQWLWDTIHANKPWTGLVKNRCKNGDFYWVFANVTPLIKDDEVTGYVSVRSKPTRDDIKAASQLYAAINNGEVTLGKKTLWQKINFVNSMKIWHKIAATLLLVAAMLSSSWLLTLQGLSVANDGLLMAGNDRKVGMSVAMTYEQLQESHMLIMEAALGLEAFQIKKSGGVILENITIMQAALDTILAADLTGEEKTTSKEFADAVRSYIDMQLQPAARAMQAEDIHFVKKLIANMKNSVYSDVISTKNEFQSIQNQVSLEEAEEADLAYHSILSTSIEIVSLSIILAILFSFLLIRGFIRRLNYATKKLESIAEGHYFNWVNVGQMDEIGNMLEGLKSMQIRQGYSMLEVRQQALEALRIKEALDKVSVPVQIADDHYDIFYMNDSAKQMFVHYKDDFRQVLSGFDPENLMGSNIDTYHKDPAHQRRMLDSLTTPFTSGDMRFGERVVVQVTASPVINESGDRVATVVEWLDRTAEASVEKEVESIIEAAQVGKLDQRLTMEGKTGFFASLSGGMNSLLDVTESGVEDLINGLQALERGDLTYRITNDYEGSFDAAKQANNNTAEKLMEILGNVNTASEEVESGSSEIAEGNNTLSTRTQEQAAALEETAASIEEITGTVQQTADNSRQANQLAVDAKIRAEKGGEVAGQAVKAMEEINASSRKISDIISVIDEIAFQTNLLALNAAVEAARAGEQGRGFAVVAGEVRSLAQRSAEAAKEIKVLITQSVESVDSGSKLVNESGAALNEIVGAVSKVSDIIAEIAAASGEQTSGIEQINQAIAQLDSGTQQNTALVEESAAASQRLNEQADSLRQQVSVFNLG